jgi:hypothetical protein
MLHISGALWVLGNGKKLLGRPGVERREIVKWILGQ